MSTDQYRIIFARKLQEYMKKRGKTQADIIADLGFKSGTVSMWVNGKRLPRMDKMEILANYLGCQPSDLYQEKDDPEIDLDVLAKAVNIIKEIDGRDKRNDLMKKIDKLSEDDVDRLISIVDAWIGDESDVH